MDIGLGEPRPALVDGLDKWHGLYQGLSVGHDPNESQHCHQDTTTDLSLDSRTLHQALDAAWNGASSVSA